MPDLPLQLIWNKYPWFYPWHYVAKGTEWVTEQYYIEKSSPVTCSVKNVSRAEY